MHMLNRLKYIFIVYAKYQKVSVKVLVQVDFPVYALSKQKQNKQTGKMAKTMKLSFCQKLIFWHKTSSCKCSMCPYYDSFNKSSGTSWFPCTCTVWALTKPLLRSKVLKNCQVQNAVVLAKSNFMASNFMQMFNVSTLCMQSIRWLQ